MTILGQVPAQKNSKKISCRGNRPVLYTLPAVKQWQEDVAWQLKGCRPVKGTVSVKITIFNGDRRRRDLDNQATSILDALVKAGVIEDDSCKVVTELHIYYGGVDKISPRANIEVNEA